MGLGVQKIKQKMNTKVILTFGDGIFFLGSKFLRGKLFVQIDNKRIVQFYFSFSYQKWQSKWNVLDQQNTFILSYSFSSFPFFNHDFSSDKNDRSKVTRYF